jgi:hypothetical protein
MTRCPVKVKSFVHEVYDKLEAREKGVGWAGVRSVFSTHCSAKLHSRRGDQLIVNF